jgi:hypothetical protein
VDKLAKEGTVGAAGSGADAVPTVVESHHNSGTGAGIGCAHRRSIRTVADASGASLSDTSTHANRPVGSRGPSWPSK